MINRSEWANRVGYHPAESRNIQKKHERFRERVFDLGVEIIDNLPNTRERSLALTNLEDALMWTNKAIAIHESPLSDDWQRVQRVAK